MIQTNRFASHPVKVYGKSGEWSVADFAGGFALIDLPSIQSIEIGSIEKKSNNFYFCSFAIQSNGRERNELTSRSSLFGVRFVGVWVV